jgi:hypothetical protein
MGSPAGQLPESPDSKRVPIPELLARGSCMATDVESLISFIRSWQTPPPVEVHSADGSASPGRMLGVLPRELAGNGSAQDRVWTTPLVMSDDERRCVQGRPLGSAITKYLGVHRSRQPRGSVSRSTMVAREGFAGLDLGSDSGGAPSAPLRSRADRAPCRPSSKGSLDSNPAAVPFTCPPLISGAAGESVGADAEPHGRTPPGRTRAV